MSDDFQLIAAIRRGETAAFETLVRKYQDRVFNVVRQVVGDHQEAEDLVQETFVQAYVKLDSFHGHSAFYTWLYRIAFNVSVSRRRRKRPLASISSARDEHSGGGIEPQDRGEAPGERLLREERAGLVQAALAALDEDFRTILVLREIEGFDYEAISEILDLPIGTVRSRLHRARSELRERLKVSLAEVPAERT